MPTYPLNKARRICLIVTLFCASICLARATWTLLCGGDLMLYNIPPHKQPFSCLHPILKTTNIRYANLEIPLTTSKTPTTRKTPEELKKKTQFILKADPKHIDHLKQTGWNVLSLGNNHAMDYGPQGIRETISLVTKQGIQVTGAGENWEEATKPAILTTPSRKRIGITSYLAFMGSGSLHKCTPAKQNTPGIATLDLGGSINAQAVHKIKQIVCESKKHCDFLIVALHWGIEKQTTPTPYQVHLGRAFIDNGADAILGAHPHVLQGAEIYKGKPILYSLGNLVSARPGSTALFKLDFQGNHLKKIQIIPLQMQKATLNFPSPQKASEISKYFQGLCKIIQKRYPNSQSTIPNIF